MSVRPAEAHALEVFLFVAARGLEEQDGDAAGWDVVAPSVGDEALERGEVVFGTAEENHARGPEGGFGVDYAHRAENPGRNGFESG
jgi:hypothetical protein